ncbi:ATP-binding protein [Desulfosporosinus fructosivorans]|uniref:ATP-binding protein n=1 Tax=Desulfosporosinus fructosivorans TaxID=2018669 RepID=A0A4Z0R3Q1_9FIRM|nr:ATP-binding protein [Desulfosporosinus fructosivorans]TGE37204.1 ATP-binding protein [Desulfosporosinus fructosivorans]
MEDLLGKLGNKFGVLAESDTTQLKVMAKNEDVAVGDLFIIPSRRGHARFYFFRATQYANVMNRTIDMGDVARNKLTMDDSYFADDLNDEKLIELKGMLLGYAQKEVNGKWSFHRPRRLPEHLTEVYLVTEENAVVVRELLASQLGSGIFVGYLLAGEKALSSVPVYMPPHALSHHIGVFGRTGGGKSNLLMVLIESMFRYNEKVELDGNGRKVSLLAIDPHDEFCTWPSGQRNGIEEIVSKYDFKSGSWNSLVAPFYYLTARDTISKEGQRRIRLSRADIGPQDLLSIMEFTDQQTAFANQIYSFHGERWINRLLSGDIGEHTGEGAAFLPGTISAVERRVSFLRRGQTQIFTSYDPEIDQEYESVLPDIICALESGRIITVDTTLMTELEQFLVTTVVARTLFMLRKALKSARSAETLEREICISLGFDPENGSTGMRAFAESMIEALNEGRLPYVRNGEVVRIEELPHVNVLIEEAPSVLNPERLRFGSIFRDISRQGRKFGIGLTVISQQVTAIDHGILSQLNTEITMALGNEAERKEAIKNASADLYGFEKELQVMGKGQAIMTASYRDVPLPVQAPLFDSLVERGCIR